MSYATRDGDDLLLQCHIQPRASRDAIVGVYNGRLKIQIKSPPVDGKANDHLIRFMAKTLGVAKSTVVLEKGLGNRQKTLRICRLEQLPDNFPEVPGDS